MKTFCAILLVGIIAYVEASKHKCDPFAANTISKPGGSEESDQVIPLTTFNSKQPGTYFVTAASPSALTGSSQFCTAPTHGSGCQAVVYFREITKPGSADVKVGALDLEFKTVFVGVSGTTKNAVRYEMKIKGANEDDYIFKIAPGTQVKAKEYAPGAGGKDVSVPKTITDVLESEFALFYASEKGFSLYITCDGLSMWVSYDKPLLGNNDKAEVATELAGQIEKLKKVAAKETKTNPTITKISTEISEEFEKLAAPAA